MTQPPTKRFLTEANAAIGYGAPIRAPRATAQPAMITTNATARMVASTPPAFTVPAGLAGNTVRVDSSVQHQTMLGYGAAITDAAAYCLTKYMTQAQRTALLTELFSPSGLNFSCIRIALGSSDYTAGGVPALYTYDDTPASQSDGSLSNFSIARDQRYIIPVIQEILAINPSVKVFAAPWSPPARMKVASTGGNGLIGGTFNPAYYQEFANYLVKAVQAYSAQGIDIFALSIQNEPNFQPGGYPGCQWMGQGAQQATFIQTNLAPALDAALLKTRIIAWDDNTNNASWSAYEMSAASGAQTYIDGVAWHGYALNDYIAMAQAARNKPGTHTYLTEFCLPSTYTFATALPYFAGDQGVAVPRNGGEAVMMWNLVLDQNFNPTVNPGANYYPMVTVQNDGTGALTRNADYYVLGHVSKYLAPGAVRINSSTGGYGHASTTLQTVAYLNPDGTRVLFLFNNTTSAQTLQVLDREAGKATVVTLAAGDIATLTWGVLALTAPTGTAPSLTVPGAPTGLTATASNGSINLSWTAPASAGNSPIGRYVISRGSSSGQENRPVGSVRAGTTTFTDSTDMATGTANFYTVTAINAAGAGAASNEVSATPTAPTAPTLSVTTGTAPALSWTASTGVVSYQVTRGTTAGTQTTVVATLSATQTTFNDSTANGGTTYYYKVVALNAAGTAASNEVSSASTRAAKPSTSSQPTLWLRSDSIVGVTTGSKLSAWPDSAGNTPAVQLNVANQPLYVTAAINTLPAVQFTSALTSSLIAAGSLPAENATVIVVCQRTTGGSSAIIRGMNGTAFVNGGLNVYENSTGQVIAAEVSGVGSTLVTSTQTLSGGWHVVEAAVDTLANNHLATTGGDGNVTTATPTNPYSGVTTTPTTNIGGTVGVEYGNMNIAEVLVFPTCLSTADRHSWVTYLGTIYGITISGAA